MNDDDMREAWAATKLKRYFVNIENLDALMFWFEEMNERYEDD